MSGSIFKGKTSSQKLDLKHKSSSSVKYIGMLRKFSSPYWLACIPLAAIIAIAWNTAAVAQDAKPLTPEDVQGTLNAIWVLIAAILVIFMNAGFGMLETGFCRQKNAVNILAKNLSLES